MHALIASCLRLQRPHHHLNLFQSSKAPIQPVLCSQTPQGCCRHLHWGDPSGTRKLVVFSAPPCFPCPAPPPWCELPFGCSGCCLLPLLEAVLGRAVPVALSSPAAISQQALGCPSTTAATTRKGRSSFAPWPQTGREMKSIFTAVTTQSRSFYSLTLPWFFISNCCTKCLRWAWPRQASPL